MQTFAETCDDVMETAWSTMWNVTDETPINCKRFLDGGGMELFLQCKDKFSESNDLLRNMMGLLGNVAEVKELRPQLMTSDFVSEFLMLVDSTADGIGKFSKIEMFIFDNSFILTYRN